MKIKIVLLFLLSFQFSSSQVSFSADYREYCDWNKNSEEFVNCEGYEESSLFEFNKSETMFVHTSNDSKSTYYIKSTEYDKQNEVFTYFVKSDVGNEYFCVFDPKNKVVKFLITEGEKLKLLRFYIKSIF